MEGESGKKQRPAVRRFADRLELELARHAAEKHPTWDRCRFAELEENLRHHVERLHWALESRRKARNTDELDRAREEIAKYAAHVGNYAMFLHDNAVMGRSG